MFPASTPITFQATVDKTGWTWDNADAGGRDGETWQAVIVVDAGPIFAPVVTMRMTNLVGRSKTDVRFPIRTWRAGRERTGIRGGPRAEPYIVRLWASLWASGTQQPLPLHP